MPEGHLINKWDSVNVIGRAMGVAESWTCLIPCFLFNTCNYDI